MNEEKDIIKYKIDKAYKSIEAGKALYDISFYDGFVNRLFYAVFYITSAYLLSKNIVVKTHNGVKSKFHSELSEKGLVTRNESRLFELLFMRRHEFDYADFVTYNMEEMELLYNNVSNLVNKIESLINKNKD